MTAVEQVRVLVEGYDDRAFWSGWLGHLGAVDARTIDKKTWQTTLGLSERDRMSGGPGCKGMFAFLLEDDALLFQIIPVQEQQLDGDPLTTLLDDLLLTRATAAIPYRAIIICQDDDTDAGAEPARVADSVRARLRNRGESFDALPQGARLTDGTAVLQFTWRCDDAPSASLPSKQTLERIVCAAIGDARPAHLASVSGWLGARPEPRGAEHKATAAALWAGWSADDGWAEFYKAIWRDAETRGALTRRLAPLEEALRALWSTPDPA